MNRKVRRCGGFLPVLLLLGCAHSKTRVERANSFDFSRYQRIGVSAFTDRHGDGRRIAEGIDSGLRRIDRGGADLKAIEETLKKNKPDRDFGLGIEVLEYLRNKASADAILFGAVAPDRRAVSVTMIDTESGEPVLRAVVRPSGKKQKSFAGADDVIRETLRVFESLAQ